jgi:uncharacterized protein (DUF433 family)
MVKKVITVTIMMMLITAHSVAKAQQKNPTVEELFGSYRAVSLAKIEYCFSHATTEKAKEKIGKKIILSQEGACNFGNKILSPHYEITQRTPIMEGEVYPRYIQRFFDMNGDSEDQLTLLIVSNPLDNLPFDHFEVVDNNTLLTASGCWVYTLKRIK